MHLGDDQTEDVEKRSFRRVLSGQNAEKSAPLLRAGPLVNDRLRLAVSFMQRSGEGNSNEEAQAIELNVPQMSLGDAHPKQTLAFFMRGSGVEIARAAKAQLQFLIHSPSRRQSRFCMTLPPIWSRQSRDEVDTRRLSTAVCTTSAPVFEDKCNFYAENKGAYRGWCLDLEPPQKRFNDTP